MMENSPMPMVASQTTLQHGDATKVPDLGDEDDTHSEGSEDHKLTLLQACAANTMNMFGTGPFITIPFVIAEASPAGPHAMIGYTFAGCIAVTDSFTWAELGSMMPYSGGSYVYLRECFGSKKWGRLASFLFLFMFILSGPLEVSSGFVAMAQYISYMDGETSQLHHSGLGSIFCLLSVLALYNDMKEVGKMLEVLGSITVLAIAFTIIAGFASIEPDHFKAPEAAWDDWWPCLYGLLGAARIGVYDFTGYYDANQMGDEVQNPRYVIPRAGVSTACVVTLIFLAVYLAVIAAVPWYGPDGFATKVEAGDESANYIMASFGEAIGGKALAYVMCILVILTIFGSCFAQLLGYSQIPYTAAKEGYFWEFMAHEHPTKRGVADYSLFSVGAVALLGCWAPLDLLISAMVTSLVLSQFFLQGVGLVIYRKQHPEVPRPFLVPWYPLPVVFSGIGFILIWITSSSALLYGDVDEPLVEASLLILVVGTLLYVIWSYQRGMWPWPERVPDEEEGSEAGTVWRDEHDRRFSPRPEVAEVEVNPNVLVARHSPRATAPGLEAVPGSRPHSARHSGRHSQPRHSPAPWAGGWKGLRCSPRPEAAQAAPPPHHSPHRELPEIEVGKDKMDAPIPA
eukprot:TRINITY_DN19857_c0_g1_i1.p2 TRINITY_DN19857_c0_g1~~TRINITY_DN19857_c0_g1_i1.p2  ORF type:complete len:657 (+),score=277.66 TRINITY_DN19857_c0_g1_i1:94-1971(+)